MINGLGVVGWGVGGIEAEAALLGQPLYQPMPIVVGFRLDGEMPAGSTATDLVLTVTEMLRAHGVVGKFVEFHGPGLSRLGLADRATISNMSPEFGATATLFPIDDETLRYLRMTGRPADTVARVEAYAKEQGLFRTDASPEPRFNESLSLDLGSVVPSVAGPRRPQDRVALSDLVENFRGTFAAGLHTHDDGSTHDHAEPAAAVETVVDEASEESFPASDPPSYTQRTEADSGPEPGQPAPPAPAPHTNHGDTHYRAVEVDLGDEQVKLRSGSVVIAAITSCTNTSNPSVMVAAGLLARNAVARGLRTPAWVKTSLAPGSRAVTDYLEGAGLMDPLQALGFDLVGYGCTTCIGNSGPLAEAIAEAIDANDLVGVAVLSGNRNFEGRIHPQARASYLASPPLVVAFALAGRIDVDLTSEPLGIGSDGRPVYLSELWPSNRGGGCGGGRAGALGGLHAQLRIGLRRRRALARAAGAGRQSLRLGSGQHVRGAAALLLGPRRRAGAAAGHRGRARARHARRQRDHRPHLAGGLDRAHLAGRGVADGARRGAARLQQLRQPPRPPRGDDARHLRQHPAAQPADPRPGGQRHRAPAQRRADEHLRRRHALCRRRDAAGRAGRQGVRLGQQP